MRKILWDKVNSKEVSFWLTDNDDRIWIDPLPDRKYKTHKQTIVLANMDTYELRDELDELFYSAGWICLTRAATNSPKLQRMLRISNSRAVKILEQLENKGVISTLKGFNPREILMTQDEFSKKFKDLKEEE